MATKGTGYGSQNGKDKPTAKRDQMGGLDDAVFRGYINLDLTPKEKELYEAWSNSASFWEALEAQTGVGVNISLKRELKQGGFFASGTQRDPKSPNAGLVVTARGRTAVTAFGRLLYCLTLLSHAQSWEEIKPLADPDRW